MLKTLEEAPAHVILVLTVDNAEQLLPTITSRCEVLRLRPLPVETVAGYLHSHGADESQAHLLASLTDGRPGLALRLLSDPDSLSLRTKQLDDLNRLLHASRVEKFAFAEKMAKDKEAFRNTLLTWSSYWRDVMLSTAQPKAPLANIDRQGEISSLAGLLDLPRARRLVSVTEQAVERLDKNVNPRLLAEVLLLDLPTYK
jgi:DNA polymerase-3 subunit delta'